MATDLNRMTFVVTEDIEVGLDKLKRQVFYNKSNSDMIRTLIKLGIKQAEAEAGIKSSK